MPSARKFSISCCVASANACASSASKSKVTASKLPISNPLASAIFDCARVAKLCCTSIGAPIKMGADSRKASGFSSNSSSAPSRMSCAVKPVALIAVCPFWVSSIACSSAARKLSTVSSKLLTTSSSMPFSASQSLLAVLTSAAVNCFALMPRFSAISAIGSAGSICFGNGINGAPSSTISVPK